MARRCTARQARGRRPSIAPEKLRRARWLPILYPVRSERLLMEQLNYNLLFRWFVGMERDEAVWNHAVSSPGNRPAGSREQSKTKCLTRQWRGNWAHWRNQFKAADHLRSHPEFSWQQQLLRDMNSYSWTTFNGLLKKAASLSF